MDHLGPSKLSPPFRPCAQGDRGRQATFSWCLGSDREKKFSYKMVLSIHTQDHRTVWDVGGGLVRSYETIGI